MKENRTKKALRNIFWGAGNILLSILLPFVNRTVLVYVLGINYLGLDSLFVSILQMLNIMELGFSSAVVFCMYVPIAKNDNKKICAVLNLYRKAYRLIGVIILAAGLMIVPLLPKLIRSDLPEDVNLYLVYFIFLINTVLGYWLSAYKKSVISAFQREDVISNINTVIIITKTMIQVVVVYFFKQYYLYILIMPVTTVIENMIIAVVSKKMFPNCYASGMIDDGTKADIKKRISGLFIQNVCSMSRNSLDNIVLSAFAGLSMVTVYGNYYYIMIAVKKLMTSITKSTYTVIGNKMAAYSVEENHADMLKFNFMYMWLANICTTCLLCLYQPFMVIWMGENMLLPASVVVLMCVYFYSLCIGDVRLIYHNGAGLWWESRYRSILEVVSNLILNIMLGYYFGIAGIIFASTFSILIINFLYGSSILYKYYFKNQLLYRYYLHQIYGGFVTCITAAISYSICGHLPGGGFLNLFLRLIVCIIVSNLMLFICNFKREIFKETCIFLKTRFL